MNNTLKYRNFVKFSGNNKKLFFEGKMSIQTLPKMTSHRTFRGFLLVGTFQILELQF